MRDTLVLCRECIAMSVDERENAKILCCDTGKEETWADFRIFI